MPQSDLTKVCTRCGQILSLKKFHKEPLGRHGVMSVCKDCRRGHSTKWAQTNRERATERQQEWRAKNKDKVAISNRKQQLRRKYGITEAEYEAMYTAQAGRCAICGIHGVPPRQGSRADTLCVDHCHDTGAVRGLLCMRCNQGVGFFRDDHDLLWAALAYLAGPV